jgi:energy-coupling factor transporter transmembrane protein EcfT
VIPGIASSSPVLRKTRLDRLDPATLLAMVVLGIISSLVASDLVLVAMVLVLFLALVLTGLGFSDLSRAFVPWVPMILFILTLHVFTTTAAAPLGHPSWGGLGAGIRALAKVGTSLGWLALFARLKSLDDLVRGVRWWLRPLEIVGFPSGQSALVLAVALGTVPAVMSEGRRVEAVLRMRRASSSGKKVSRWRRFMDRVVVVVPLTESLLRRAEAFSLSLRTRQPATALAVPRPPLWQLAVLALWLGLLVSLLWTGELS